MENLQEVLERLEKIESLLLTKKEMLNFDEVSAYTGLSKSYLYKLTSSSSIPHYKPNGKIIFFKTEEIRDWCLQNRVRTISEIDQEASNRVKFGKSI
jgi:excisionase family DNA binding protein